MSLLTDGGASEDAGGAESLFQELSRTANEDVRRSLPCMAVNIGCPGYNLPDSVHAAGAALRDVHGARSLAFLDLTGAF